MGPMDLGIAPPGGYGGRMKRAMSDQGAGMKMSSGPLDIGPAKSGGEAPNLRMAEDPNASCGACRHFDGQGMCGKYRTECSAEQTCDGFEPGEEGGMGEELGESMMD